MIEAVKTIALLCQVHPALTGPGFSSYSPREVERHQNTCQIYYLDCMTLRTETDLGWRLVRCVRDKK